MSPLPRFQRRAATLAMTAAFVGATCLGVHTDAAARPTLPTIDATTVSAFDATVHQDGLQRQVLVKNGRVYERNESDWNTWRDYSASFNGIHQVGEGEITALDTEVYADHVARQFITRNGEVFRRIQHGPQWTAWESITPLFEGIGQGRITSFGVTQHGDGLLRQTLVRGGQVHRRVQRADLGWTGWVDVSWEFRHIGPADKPINAVSAEVYADGDMRWFVTRGNQVYRRLATQPDWQPISHLFQSVGHSGKPRVPAPIHKRVLVLEFNPIIESHNRQRLNVVMKQLDDADLWHDPRVLEHTFIDAMERATDNVVQYTVADRVVIDAFPPRRDGGMVYTDETYIECFLASPKRCDGRENLDYNRVLAEHRVCERINAYEVDEVWLMTGPFFGTYEANMTGPNAFWTNGQAINAPSCQRSAHIMGFSYEREPERMLENMGHRIEGTMEKVTGRWWNDYANKGRDWPAQVNIWERFTARGFDRTTAACGNIHGGLNSPVYNPANPWMYDFRNPNVEDSTCADWENYPDLTGATTPISAATWNASDMGWHMYWHGRIPNFSGTHAGMENNWWRYMLDWDAVRPGAGT